MPKAKRSPIDYTPQFGAGIFRPKEAVEQELATLAEEASVDSVEEIAQAYEPPARSAVGEAEAGVSRRRDPRPARTNGATNERTNERTSNRSRVRHSFDIWQDQLLGLSEIQAERFSRTGRKPKLGELVQEALDAYIAKERKRTNVRTNER